MARLQTRIAAAQRSIDAAIYSMSGTAGTSVANALIAAWNRGVKVRVICEYDNSSSAAFNSLVSAGIPLINDRFDPINYGDGLMHDKFFVVDGRGGAPESVWVWTGSWNLTDPGTDADYQNAIEVQDQALAVVYTMEFQEMWGSATDVAERGGLPLRRPQAGRHPAQVRHRRARRVVLLQPLGRHELADRLAGQLGRSTRSASSS